MCVYVGREQGVLCKKRWLNVAWEVTFVDYKTSGCDLGNLIGESTGSIKHDLAKSRENTRAIATCVRKV